MSASPLLESKGFVNWIVSSLVSGVGGQFLEELTGRLGGEGRERSRAA
jgi:hypothetical protein